MPRTVLARIVIALALFLIGVGAVIGVNRILGSPIAARTAPELIGLILLGGALGLLVALGVFAWQDRHVGAR